MQNFSALLASRDGQLYLERSGMATRCRLACEALAQGRGAVIFWTFSLPVTPNPYDWNFSATPLRKCAFLTLKASVPCGLSTS